MGRRGQWVEEDSGYRGHSGYRDKWGDDGKERKLVNTRTEMRGGSGVLRSQRILWGRGGGKAADIG